MTLDASIVIERSIVIRGSAEPEEIAAALMVLRSRICPPPVSGSRASGLQGWRERRLAALTPRPTRPTTRWRPR